MLFLHNIMLRPTSDHTFSLKFDIVFPSPNNRYRLRIILVSAAGENFEVLWYRKSVFPLQNHRKQCQNVEIFACGAS